MRYYFSKMKVLLVAIAIIAIGFILVWFKILGNLSPAPDTTTENEATQSGAVQVQAKVDLYVDYGNGKTTSFERVPIDSKGTVYSLLTKKMNETGSSVTTKSYDFGTMVDSINGIKSSNEYFWAYSVNEQTASVAADKYILKNGDVVEWKYTKIQ